MNAPRKLISAVFSTDDVESIADELEIDPALALERVEEWSGPVEDRLISLGNELLYEIVKTGQP